MRNHTNFDKIQRSHRQELKKLRMLASRSNDDRKVARTGRSRGDSRSAAQFSVESLEMIELGRGKPVQCRAARRLADQTRIAKTASGSERKQGGVLRLPCPALQAIGNMEAYVCKRTAGRLVCLTRRKQVLTVYARTWQELKKRRDSREIRSGKRQIRMLYKFTYCCARFKTKAEQGRP